MIRNTRGEDIFAFDGLSLSFEEPLDLFAFPLSLPEAPPEGASVVR